MPVCELRVARAPRVGLRQVLAKLECHLHPARFNYYCDAKVRNGEPPWRNRMINHMKKGFARETPVEYVPIPISLLRLEASATYVLT
jgi:hypothetical protein